MKFVDSQHIMMMESVTEKKFKPPASSEEKILANRFSGFKNPQFALLASQLQSFSLYDELLTVGDADYLSPLCNGATRKYLFIIEDTVAVVPDTVFTISFRPRSGKNFDALKGTLFINTNGYAIQQVIAEPAAEDPNLNIKIQQQCAFVDEKRWFPVQLNSFLSLPMLDAEGLELVGIGKTYLQKIELESELKRRDFDGVILKIDPLAGRQDSSLWEGARVDALSEKELKTYHVIDSLGEEMNFDRLARSAQILATGKIPFGKISADLDHLLRFNDYEGFRLGLGLETNERLIRWMSVGGYGAYGFKDKAWKYGGHITFDLFPYRQSALTFSASHDVIESGGISFNRTSSLDDQYYELFMNRMDTRDQWKAQLNVGRWGFVHPSLYVSRERREVNYDYRFARFISDDIAVLWDRFDLFEYGAEVKISFREKFVQTGSTT
ncbi:MAG: hypothetical protein HKN32_07450, partial [Flavobacteriales bacterium]|nr:hypothetical protein [Flavobacteriales bacterium]